MAREKGTTTPKQRVDISKVVKAVQIKSVRLLDSSSRRNVEEPRSVSPISINVQYGAKVRRRNGSAFVVDAPLKMVLKDSGSNKHLVRISVTFRLKYSLDERMSEDISQELLETFAELNGTFNAWPYWREFVHQTFQRMELPPVVLPAYRYSEGVSASKKSGTRKLRKRLKKGVAK